MGRNRKSYSALEKRKVAIEAIQNEKPLEEKTIAQIAAEHNIAPSTVTEWKEEFKRGESKELRDLRKKYDDALAQIEQLNTVLGAKTFECELLKKNDYSLED